MQSCWYSGEHSCLPHPVSCPRVSETSTRWKKVTTWCPHCSHDISCHNSENWPQGNGSKWPWNWRLTVLTIKMMGFRPPMASFNTAVRADCAISACSHFPQPTKLLPTDCQWWGISLWKGVYPPNSLVASIQDKAAWPLYWLLNKEKPDPTFGYITTLRLLTIWPSDVPVNV